MKSNLEITKNYNSKTLTAITAMAYNALIVNCIQSETEKILRKNQNDFRKNQATQILTIHRIIEGERVKISRENYCSQISPDFKYTTGKWRKCFILPFSPKRGNLGITKNYRGINLTAVLAKVYTLAKIKTFSLEKIPQKWKEHFKNLLGKKVMSTDDSEGVDCK